MNEVVTVSYNTVMLAASFGLSVLGSYAGLTAGSRIVGEKGSVSGFHAGVAGLAIGGAGIWSMHFLGMLALKFDLRTGYALVETAVSLVAAVLATVLALNYVAKDPNSPLRLGVAGVLLGLGVCVMHYLGMAGMRFGGVFAWNWPLVAASVAIAIVAATAALWLAFRSNTLAVRFLAALIMGVAVCAMHYTGMAAADIICTTPDRLAAPKGFAIIPSGELGMVVTFISTLIALLVIIDRALRVAMGDDDEVATASAKRQLS